VHLTLRANASAQFCAGPARAHAHGIALHPKRDFCKRFGTSLAAGLLHCGKSLYQRELAYMLRCSSQNALPETSEFCIFGGLLFRLVKFPCKRSDGHKPPDCRQGR